MPGREEEKAKKARREAPRTNLPPEKDPYYEGYFGTDEEEGVVREHEEQRDEGEDGRDAAEDSAGGDREIG